MSLPSEIMSLYEDIYEECLEIATKNMAPLGYSPAEIKAAANDLYEEKIVNWRADACRCAVQQRSYVLVPGGSIAA